MKSKLQTQSLYAHISSLAFSRPKETSLVRCNEEGIVEESISWENLKLKINSAASFLRKEGINIGDVIGIAMHNSVELLVLNWAAWSMGIITAPLDTKRDTLENHLYKLKLSQAKILIAQKEIFTEEQRKSFKNIKFTEIDDFGHTNSIENLKWMSDLSHQALILFTSGTTSRPKGAQLSLENLVINADGIREWFKITAEDRFMVNLPLHHINSTTFCLSTLLAGGSISVLPNYSNSRFWQQAANTSSTFTSIVPSICFDQLSRIKEFEAVKDRLKMNRIQIGSAPVVSSDVEKFVKLFGIPLYQGYGQTETALRVTGVPLDTDKKTYTELVQSNSIGKAMDWASINIVDEQGNVLGENKEGELAVKGPAIMKGYLGNIDAFKNGYFMTGDIGYFKVINNEKYYFLKGRKKEIIIKGGINISPVAVEDKLKKINSDIDQVYVIGIEDKRYGEEVGAVICWKKMIDSEKAKINLKYQLIRGSGYISSYESPQYLFSFNSADLPMTSTGKVQRSILKSKINKEDFEAVNFIYKNTDYEFLFLTLSSPYFAASFNLYNYCWDPLVLNVNEFKKQIKNGSAIVAVDSNNKVCGLILLIRTNISEKELSLLSYSKLISTGGDSINSDDGKSFVCVAICSSNYKPQDIPKVNLKPTVEDVREYLFAGRDSVYSFHAKPKGGFTKGASLISLLPNSRPEDKRSMGFNMLLKYPEITKEIQITKSKLAVATQLIEVVMFLVRQLGIEFVYAFSRPADLAKYLSQKETE